MAPNPSNKKKSYIDLAEKLTVLQHQTELFAGLFFREGLALNVYSFTSKHPEHSRLFEMFHLIFCRSKGGET